MKQKIYSETNKSIENMSSLKISPFLSIDKSLLKSKSLKKVKEVTKVLDPIFSIAEDFIE